MFYSFSTTVRRIEPAATCPEDVERIPERMAGA